MLLLSAPAVRRQRFPGQVVCRDRKYAVQFSVRDIDDAQVSARCCPAQSNPGTFAARPILSRLLQHVDDLGLVHPMRSEEHTSELQSLRHLVCRLLLEKKKKKHDTYHRSANTTPKRVTTLCTTLS